MRETHERLWSRNHEDGERLSHDGHYTEAEAKFHAAIQHAKGAGIHDARLATTLYQLAGLAERRGQRAEALELYKRSLDTEEHALGADHPYVAMILRSYAGLLRRAGHAGQAAALDARADAIWAGGSGGRTCERSAPAA